MDDRGMDIVGGNRRSRSVAAGVGALLVGVMLWLVFVLAMQSSHRSVNYVGATLIDGKPNLVIGLCANESVTALFVNDSSSSNGEGPTLWRIDAIERDGLDMFVVGETPSGFKETIRLQGALPAGRLAAWALIDDHLEMLNSIDVSQLEEGALSLSRKPISDREFFGGRRCGKEGPLRDI